LGIALHLFRSERNFRAVTKRYPIYVHRRAGDCWEIDNRLSLDEDDAGVFDGLMLPTLTGGMFDERSVNMWIVNRLDEIRAVFSAKGKADLIVLAAEWLFNSFRGKDELLGYVQAMVVLEILLGDKATSDEIGLGALLRNRCAYLIGRTHKDRAELLDAFDDIYKVRSQILHRGKHRLSTSERQLFEKLLWMCRRVIQEEVNLLKADLS